MRAYRVMSLLLLFSPSLLALPMAQQSTGVGPVNGVKTDLPVEQLEKLKLNESIGQEAQLTGTAGAKEHINYHSLETVKANGELVSQVEQHATVDAGAGNKPQVHSHVQLDVPAEGIHKEIVQDGDRIVEHDGTPTTTTAISDEQTTKVFHGAARLIQAGSGTNVPQNTHTAVRRAFNADSESLMDRFPSAQIRSMASYVYWTGDEKGITSFIEELLEEGLMTKEEAINFLQEIKYQLDAMRKKAGIDLMSKDGYQYQPVYMNVNSYPPFSFMDNPDAARTAIDKNLDMSNAINPNLAMLPLSNDIRSEMTKRIFDPSRTNQIYSSPEFERDTITLSKEEYEEMIEKLKAADTLFAEFTLEEFIYELAKMMFTQSLTRDPRDARLAIQRFMAYIELEAKKGQLSRSVEKKVLDVMVAALTDTIGDHPELLQSREGLGGNPENRLIRQFLEQNVAEPSMSRAIISAYKDDLLKGHKAAYPERN